MLTSVDLLMSQMTVENVYLKTKDKLQDFTRVVFGGAAVFGGNYGELIIKV